MTDLAPTRRRLLPLLTADAGAHGGRSPMTCRYRCGDACAHDAPNTSDNPYFGDVVAQALSRRGLLKAGALSALVVGAGAGGLQPAAAAGTPAAGLDAGADAAAGLAERGLRGPLTFDPVETNTVDRVIVPNGYDSEVLISWGDPVEPGAPRFDFDRQTAAAQAKQFGYNNDFVALLPLRGRHDRGLLVVNHEYTNEELMFRGWSGAANATPEQLRISMAAHGLSVVEVERVRGTGQWRVARRRDRYNRRITVMTPMRLTGPAAGHPLLRTSADPTGTRVLGTLNNCAGGVTPWGTTLHGEENFNGYFTGAPEDAPADQQAAFRRYGIGNTPSSSSYRGWDRVDPRFDIKREPNEANRFGYIVELDPTDPHAAPRKRTMLGRFKHEGANVRLAHDGRVVAYMGDDERFDYVYKFVSKKAMRRGSGEAARRHNATLLDSGTLYVARFTGDSPKPEIDGFAGSGTLPSDGAFDGTGEWIPLTTDTRSFVPGFTVAQVLIHTRLAADLVGPTKMDRPEDVEPSPVTGTVYAALTNNTRRTPAQVDEANPRPDNKFGSVLEWTERGNDPTATRFTWRIFLLCGDPADKTTYYAGFDKSQVSPLACPDNLAFDPTGNLWISTDGQPGPLGFNDGFYAVATEGAQRGNVKLFATVALGAEATGPFFAAGGRTFLMAVQHPGEEDGATPDKPFSRFPFGDQPRPSVVVAWRTAPGSKRVGA